MAAAPLLLGGRWGLLVLTRAAVLPVAIAVAAAAAAAAARLRLLARLVLAGGCAVGGAFAGRVRSLGAGRLLRLLTTTATAGGCRRARVRALGGVLARRRLGGRDGLGELREIGGDGRGGGRAPRDPGPRAPAGPARAPPALPPPRRPGARLCGRLHDGRVGRGVWLRAVADGDLLGRVVGDDLVRGGGSGLDLGDRVHQFSLAKFGRARDAQGSCDGLQLPDRQRGEVLGCRIVSCVDVDVSHSVFLFGRAENARSSVSAETVIVQ